MRKVMKGNRKIRRGFRRAAALALSAVLMASNLSLDTMAATTVSENDTETVADLNLTTVSENEVSENVLAWDTVEGGGRYTSGGRGKPVYHVTSLEDYLLSDNSKNGESKTADAPVEGTLRYGIEVFALENDGAMIVFDVAGNIKLLSTLSLKERSNITIAGQTAPGDGITISGMDTNMSNSDNIIIRYIRFRPGRTYVFTDAADSIDAFWGRDNTNFIIDHCSFSWNTDETLSIYRGMNGTVTNNIISESLTISGHSKGRHGYGGIFGGENVTFTDNLIASHTSRNARIGGGYLGDPTVEGEYYKNIATLQVSNNVIYNWGYNGTYGLGWTHTNFINNYLKPGRGTRDSVDNLIINPGEADGTLGPKEAGVYVNGNVLVGYDDYSADNSLGIRMNSDAAIQAVTEIADTPYEAEGFDSLTVTSAEEAYTRVLNTAGATLPRRDAIDARIVAETRNDLGRYLNTEDEAGGYISAAGVVTASREEGYDTDGDGMPDTYEDAQGFDRNNAADGMALAVTGRSNLEEYLISITDDEYVPANPVVSVSLENNAQFDEGEAIAVTVDASADAGIAKVELYNGSTVVDTKTEAPYSFSIEGLTNGTYNISARAYDNDGNATQASAAVIYVNNPSGPSDWTSLDIGNPGVPGSASYGTETIGGNTVENVLTVKGSGKLGKSEGSVSGKEWSDSATDNFQYTYQAFSGDGEIVARLEEVSTVDNHAFTGIMFRETLDENSKAAAVGLSFVKYTNTTWSVLLASRKTTGGAMSDLTESIDSESAATKAGIPLIADIPFRVQKDKQSITQGTWLKLVRQGETFSAYTSQDNVTWTLVGSQEIEMAEDIYVGFAVDGNKVANDIDNMSWAQFSNISIKNDLYNITADFANVSVDGLATTIAGGDDLNITLVPDNGYQLPDSITVTVGGVEVEAEYEFSTGNVTIKNVTGDVVIKAVGTVKAAAARENYEIIDLNSEYPLSVSEKDGSLTLTQSATKGSMADSNVSYLVFPATEDEGTLSMKVKVKSFNYEKGSGVFIGAFMPDNNSGSRYFMSLGMRNPDEETGDSLSAYWYKATKIGNGSPKSTLALDTEYEVEISWDKSNQMVASWNVSGDSTINTKTFKLSECHADLYDYENEDKTQYIAKRRFGIAISGATAEITDLVYYNSNGEELYNQDVDGTVGAPEVGTLNTPVIAEDNSSISVSWTGKETLAENDSYAVEITKDDKLIKKFTTAEKTYTLSVIGDGSDNGVYAFKVYGVNGTATTVAQTVSVELNVEESKVQDGFKATTAKEGITYYFDFQDATSDIWDKGEAEEATQGTSLKTGSLGLLTVVSAGKFHSADHGMNNVAEFNIQVAGNCTISIGGCKFTGDSDMFTMSSTTGTLDATQKASKTTNCYDENCVDGSDRVVFTYTGEAGSVNLKCPGAYVPRIIVTPVVVVDNTPDDGKRVIEVWDFAGQEESDTDLYNNNITDAGWEETGLVASDGTLDSTSTKTVTFGQLTMVYENGDKIYGGNNTATHNYSTYEYEDGYTSDGLWYCNGKGGSSKRYVTINDVKAGDKVVAYMGSHTVEVDELHFLYKGTEGTQDDVETIGNKECRKYEFIAKYDGSYQIYVGNSTNVKPVWHRIMLVPAAQVSGTIDVGTLGIADYGVKFINNTTEEEFEGTVENGEFTVSLTPGYEYTAVLTGVVGYGFTTASKVITVPDSAVDGGLNDVTLVVEEKDVQLLSGTISGFEADVDVTRVKVVLVAAEGSQKENASFRPAADGSYSIYVESGVSYTITLEGANDYEVTGKTDVCLNEAATKDITVGKKAVYTVSGEFIGLAEGTEVKTLKFVNMEDNYSYDATVADMGYSINLRNGVYEVEAEVSNYTTVSHVTVENGVVDRDLLFTSTAKLTAIPYVADIYVGYPEQENNYDSVRAAVTACKAMRLANDTDRITVHIAPGVYREQVIVDVPYITFKNDTPEQEVKLTWYYGIGYEYYSIGSDGYYSEAAAFDKFSKSTAQKWGAATYIKGAATEFRAEYITFESSFNKYITEEEIVDGVAPGGTDKKDFERTETSDVSSRKAVERATALAVEGNQSEFLGCKIVSSQDTLYTGNNVKAYFKNCFIDGNTDYIFGGGDFVFDGCELSFYGYSDEESGAYITAAADGSTYGYVFRNCYVSTNDDWAVAPGYLGRPWRQAAKVSFINTKMESASTILPIGWHDMSGNTAANADYREYGSTLVSGEAIDVSGRISGKAVSENPYPDITTVFAGWTPVYFVADSDNVALASDIKVATNGAKDVKVGDVLTVKFSLGENEDANVSAIRWYRVAADGTETLVKTAFAQLDRTYTVTEADLDATLKVVISPETVSGYKAEEQQLIITELEVSVDKSALQTAVNSADGLIEEKYTEESWAALQIALEAAKAELANEEATEESVAAALTNLHLAVAGLVEATKPDPTPTATPAPTATPTPTATPEPTSTPAPVTEDEQNGVTYKIEGNGVTITDIDQNVESVEIPDAVTINGQTYKVTGIPKNAFKNNTKLKSITIGNNVTSIGDYAFYGCKNLKTVKIGKNVVTIGKCAFNKCTSLTSITIPDKVKTVGVSAFDSCTKLKTVKLGKALTAISDKMFYKCTSLTKITIPAKATKIGKNAFANCTKLSSVTIGKKVSQIGSNAFYKCTSLKKVTIPASVKTIGANAFNGCKNLKSITIKTTKLTSKTVGGKAFSGINAKATIKVPSKKLADYKKLLVSKGVKKTATIKK